MEKEITIEELRARLGEFHPRTEWEAFIGHPLTVEEENDVRAQVIALLQQVGRISGKPARLA